MRPSVSIIIVTYNSAPHIAALSAALRAVRYDPPPQIVVVDNASRDESAALVRRLLPEALLLPQAANHGFGGGVRRGVAASHGERLALLNPDTVVDPGWLTALIEALDDPRCGVAGSKILDAQAQTIQHAGGYVDLPALLPAHLGYGEPDRGQHNTPAAVSFVTGASLAMRRELWDRLGGIDEGFFPGYFEDVDLCWRVRAAGLECRYAPGSLLRHADSTSTGKFSGAFYYYYHLGRLRFACKHLPWPALWGEFAPAEALRLRQASPLDRAVAGLVYRQSLPHGLAAPDAPTQALILQRGRALAAIGAEAQARPDDWPKDARALLGLPPAARPSLPGLIAEAGAEAALSEHQFRSAIPLLAALRRAWNSVATRWYVLPALHQQTRFNLAAQRALAGLHEQAEAHTQHALIEAQLRQALLCYQVAAGSAERG